MRLIFDDGPGPLTEQILELLDGTRAMFGIVGQEVKGHEHLLQRMVAEGHTIVNHTMTHPVLTRISGHEIARELLDCTEVIERACGFVPTVFRPPYVRISQRMLNVARNLGFTEILIDSSVGDYNFSDPLLLACACEGLEFVGLHEFEVTVQALPNILELVAA